MKKKVVVGMSGGVDSSVAAYLLKQEGYEVIGLFMKNWEEEQDEGVCTAEADYADVRRVAALLDIPYYTVNFSKTYYDNVFTYFLEEYKRGRTPNPDVLCNREIKFKPFKEEAARLGADYIATGHYCGIRREGNRNYLLKARDQNKDQTYFLNQVANEQLSNVLFPLSEMCKDEVREIARRENLATAEKKDSTGICFIGERNFRSFLKTYLPAKPGKIVSETGEVIGEHIGLMYYTLGQRRGLDVGGVKGETGRWVVVEKDISNNILYVSHEDDQRLFSTSLVSGKMNWIPEAPLEEEFRCFVKTRYREKEKDATVRRVGDTIKVTFDVPERAVTPGQYVVLYDGEKCLGGGVIEKRL